MRKGGHPQVISPLECSDPLTLAGGHAYDPHFGVLDESYFRGDRRSEAIHEVLVEPPTGGRQRWRMVNCQHDYDVLRQRLQGCRALSASIEATSTITGRSPTSCINAGLNCA